MSQDMADICPMFRVQEDLSVSPLAFTPNAASTDCAATPAAAPAPIAIALLSLPAQGAAPAGRGGQRKRQSDTSAGPSKQQKRARGKKGNAAPSESLNEWESIEAMQPIAARCGESKVVPAYTGLVWEPFDCPANAPVTPRPAAAAAVPHGRQGPQVRRTASGGKSSPACAEGGPKAEGARSPKAQPPASTNLEASGRANHGATRRAAGVSGKPLASKARRHSLLPSPAPIFRQTLCELWTLLDPTFGLSEPASSPAQPTTSGPSQSSIRAPEMTTSEPPAPSAQSCFPGHPEGEADARVDASAAEGELSADGARVNCGQTSCGEADAGEGWLETVIGSGRRGASASATTGGGGGGGMTAREVEALHEAVAAAHTAARGLGATAGSFPAEGATSSAQQSAAGGATTRSRGCFSRQGSSNAPHAATPSKGGKAAAGRHGGQGTGADRDAAGAARRSEEKTENQLASASGAASAPAAAAGASPHPTAPPAAAPSPPPAALATPSPASPPPSHTDNDTRSSGSMLADLSLESPSLGPQGPSFESQLNRTPSSIGSPKLSLQAHSIQSIWPKESTPALPFMSLLCDGAPGSDQASLASGSSPNLLPSLELQVVVRVPPELESKEHLEVDWARLPDLDEMPSPSPRLPNLDTSLTPRLLPNLEEYPRLALYSEHMPSDELRATQVQQGEGKGEAAAGEGMDGSDGEEGGRGGGDMEMGGMRGGKGRGMGVETQEGVCELLGGTTEEDGPVVDYPLPECASVTQPCLAIGLSWPAQPISVEGVASVAPMDFEAAASMAAQAELWQSPQAVCADGNDATRADVCEIRPPGSGQGPSESPAVAAPCMHGLGVAPPAAEGCGLEGRGEEEEEEEDDGGAWEELEVVVCGVKGGAAGSGGREEGSAGERAERDLASVVRQCTSARLYPTPPTAAVPAALVPPPASPATIPHNSLPAAAAAAASKPSAGAAAIAAGIAAASPATGTHAAATAATTSPAAAMPRRHPLAPSVPSLSSRSLPSPSLPAESRHSTWAAACWAAQDRSASRSARSSVSAGPIAAGAVSAGAIPPHLLARALSCSSISASRTLSLNRPLLDRALSSRELGAALPTQSVGQDGHGRVRGRVDSSSTGMVKEPEGMAQLMSRVATVDWEEVRRPMSRAAQSIQCDWARRRQSSLRLRGDIPLISAPDSCLSDGSVQEGVSKVGGDRVGWGGVGDRRGRGAPAMSGLSLNGVSDVSAGAGSCVKGV
ncbi:hypothetical protein CLOM_g15391 [Closterium sp. NIES-68]|nr:hypothetical protein CLOM_g15391 [Closterium sp. NIES-68]GJP65682.1 hypothetical protein CLOP_g22548 [Closterium sp. NIES-67]